MTRNAASARQVLAAEPGASTWLSANAGSGKTRVLTDRVARLLLGGTEPQHILCLTYTKAAASEMQNRLFRRLGEWAMLEEGRLRAALAELGIDGPVGAETLAEARRLFARAIETPGGLRIQTIHSFCAGLLRRFPLEAGVSPDFTEIDDRAAELMRAEIVEELAGGGDIGAVDALAGLVAGDDLAPVLADLCRNGDAFARPLTPAEALALFGLPPDWDRAALMAEVLAGGEADLLAALIPLLAGSGANDRRAAERLAAIDLADVECLAALEEVLLTGKAAKHPFTAKLGAFPTRDLRLGPCAPLMPRVDALMQRVEAARPRRIALAAAERAAALHRFAAAFLPRYHARKAARGWLDFDDLIARAGHLLSDRSVAQWVLFRLDGGIDHILVDEAQDTSPGQWAVIERLSEEFTAGEGAREGGRTLFVVGDKKQSIYSFQGADLGAFDRMRGQFASRFEAAGAAMRDLTLDYSFRSAPAVLRIVDLAFEGREHRGIGGAPRHLAFKAEMPGRVDLWPPIPRAEREEPPAWDAPVDQLPQAHPAVQLARRIAGWIAGTIAAGTQIPVPGGARPVHEGDFLILVQRRSELFAEIIAACKAAGLAIAGADRLKLGGELAVKDIRAVLAFLATPEDDLSLAAALRSPLFGWTEAQLYALAQPRKGYLWAELRGRADHAETRTILTDLRDLADFLRPYELIERLLTRHGGRKRLVARLGPEAEDGIDELLTQALAFERSAVPSLTGFLVWMEGGDVEVKRRPEAAGRAIRVMTVHGAKGLEAPVVILPDTIRGERNSGAQILRLEDGVPVWGANAADSPPVMAAAREAAKAREAQERDRLLYVAMTRAESWLVVCGAGDPGNGGEQWWSLVAAAMEKAGAEAVQTGFGPIRRFASGEWPADAPGRAGAPQAPALPLPDWALQAAPPAAGPEKPLSPSALGGPKALSGETAGLDEDAALRRGRQLHLLLEHLPDWPAEAQAEVALRLLSVGEDRADPAEAAALLAEAQAVLASPAMAPWIGPDTLAEVEITARLPELGGRLIHGVLDRLWVGEDRVLAIDYKSNAIVPSRPEDVPPGLLRQMGAYAAALEQIYPGRRIDTAILWTGTGALMPLPCDMVRAALRAATIP